MFAITQIFLSLPCCDRMVPRPFKEDSVSIVNSLEKLGYPSTGAVLNASFNASNTS